MSRSATWFSSKIFGLVDALKQRELEIHTEHIHDLLHVVQLDTGLDDVLDTLNGALDSAGNLIDILRLDNSLQVILQDLGEVV
jgi:hypothetical protein